MLKITIPFRSISARVFPTDETSMLKITIPNAIQLQASAVSCKRRRRFWASLVSDIRFSSLAWVSGLLALLVVAVSPASAQETASLVILSEDGIPVGTTENPLVLREDEGSVAFTVHLSTQPVDADNIVALMPAIMGAEGVMLSLPSLEFLPGGGDLGWDVPRKITVRVANDDIAQGTRYAEITFAFIGSSTDPLYVDASAVVSPTMVTIIDDDPASTKITLGVAPSSGQEGDSVSVTITAVLDAAARTQSTNVGLSIQYLEAMEEDVTFPGGTVITISAGDRVGSVDVLLNLEEDYIDEGSETFRILGGVMDGPGMDADFVVESTTFTIVDNDTRGIEVPTRAIELTEGGGGEEYSVVLTSEPTAPVAVMLSVTGAEGVMLSSSSLQFSETKDEDGGWNVPQAVTVTVEDDGIAQGTRNAEITYVVSGGDGDYQDIEITPTEVIVLDDDIPSTAIIVTADQDSGEEGASVPVKFTAVLDAAARPQDTNLVLEILGAGTDEVTLSGEAGTTIVIPAGQRTGTLTVVLDLEDDNIAKENLRFSISGVAPGLQVDLVPFTKLDNDTASTRIALTADQNSGEEGDSVPVKVTAMLNAAARTQDTNVTLSILGAGGIRLHYPGQMELR